MAASVGKKKEGFGALKDTKGGKRRDDRQVTSRATFEPLSVDAKNVLTVIHMLQSPEDDIVLRAVASLEGYGRKGTEQLRLLSSFGVVQYLIPLVHHKDSITKRFAQKLIGMLCSLPEVREQMFKVENALEIFVNILDKEMDVVMHEYAALTLAELSTECAGASQLLEVENCVKTLFLRLTCTDPDVQKNCLDIVNHLLMTVKGIETFVECPTFDIKVLLFLISSSYPVIQSLVIHILDQMTSWCRDTRVLFAFRDALGIEATLDVLENEEWSDLHSAALGLLINVADCMDLGEYLAQSGCLQRLVKFLDEISNKANIEKILGVLARMCHTPRCRQTFHELEMGKRFCAYLHENLDGIQEPSCLGIAYLASYAPSVEEMMTEKPVSPLIEIMINSDKNPVLRNMAGYALSNLCKAGKIVCEDLTDNPKFQALFTILHDRGSSTLELKKNVIRIFVNISSFFDLRSKILSRELMAALLSCLHEEDGFPLTDASLQVDVLECLSSYLVEWEGRQLFEALGGAWRLMGCLRNRSASVREWAGHLVVVASQSADFVKSFIQIGGLKWLIKEKNTRLSMPSWQSAIETIFSNFLPAKFAFTGRLDFQDITQDGFYLTADPRAKFCLLENFLKDRISPIFPTYVANFQLNLGLSSGSPSSSVSEAQGSVIETLQEMAEMMKTKSSTETGKHRSMAPSEYTADHDFTKFRDSYDLDAFGKYYPDPYLNDYLQHLKKKLTKEEYSFGDFGWFGVHPKLVCSRARVIAEVVNEEMSGPEPNIKCGQHYKEMHINELRFQLGTNIIPLGFVRTGTYLERAMLFKVLADRIGFPCALVRGSFGRAWIEISIPVMDIEDVKTPCATIEESTSAILQLENLSKETVQTIDSGKNSCESSQTESLWPEEDYWFPKVKMEFFKSFPNYFLKPNAIVDLINVPGKIIKLNSREADEYCGNFFKGKY